jgi:tetratricopeptide (TPR) repeat protein
MMIARTATGPNVPKAVAWMLTLAFAAGAFAQPGANIGAAHEQFVFAYRLLQRGETDLAKKAFDDYLTRFPGDEKVNDALYCRALLSRQQGDNRAAAEYLDRVGTGGTKLVPDHAMLLLRGQVYSDLGQNDKALAALEKINLQNLEPVNQAYTYYLRGLAYRATGNLDAAEAQLNDVVKLDTPMKAQALLDLARVRTMRGDKASAIETMRQCLALKDPNVSAEAARIAGDLAYETSQYTQAIDFYNTVITGYTSSPHFDDAVVGLLWSQFQLEQYGVLLETFAQHSESLRDVRNRVTAWYLAGAAHQKLGQHEKTVETLHPIVANATGMDIEDKVLYRLASSQFELSRFDEMKRTIQRLKERHPQSTYAADADFLLAVAAGRTGDSTGGGFQLTSIIDEGPGHPYYGEALMQRGRMLAGNAMYAPAAADFRALLDYAASDQGKGKVTREAILDASLRLIDVNYRRDQYELAISDAQALLGREGIDPKTQSEALYRMALAQIKLERFDPAIGTLGDLLDRFPQSGYAANGRYYRGLARLALGRTDDAIADLQTAIGSESLDRALKAGALRVVAQRYRTLGEDDQAFAAMSQLEALITVANMQKNEQLWMARYYTDREKPRLALKYLEPVLTGARVSGPEHAEALLLAARGLRALDDLDAAVKAFHEVVAIDHGFGLAARLEMARTMVRMGRVRDAQFEYEDLINARDGKIAAQAAMDSGRLYLEQAQQFKRQSDTEGAAEATKNARERFLRIVALYSSGQFTPMPQLAHLNLAEIDTDAGDKPSAIGRYRELADSYPDTPFAVYASAMVDVLEGRPLDGRFKIRQLSEQDKPLEPALAQRVEAKVKSLQ